MNISKDGKVLYFSDEEIDNETNGEKKVFVTKRINGKESHVKVRENDSKKTAKQNKTSAKDDFFFNNEIIIGLNKEDEINTNPKEESKKTNKKQSKKEKIKESKKEKRKHSKSKPKHYDYEEPQNRKLNKQKHKKKKSKKLIVTIFSIIILIAVITIFSLTAPIFNITEIQVEGNEKIPTSTIISLSGLKKGENIFKFNNSIIGNIKENNYIESVKISRKLPGTIKITVQEREVKYQINLINSYTYIDKNGYILENSTEKKSVPVISGLNTEETDLLNEKRLKVEDLEILNDIYKITEATNTIQITEIITEIEAKNKENYILYIESKNKKVYIGDTTNLTNKMLYLKKILENEEGKSGIIFINGDINSGFKPYFREE